MPVCRVTSSVASLAPISSKPSKFVHARFLTKVFCAMSWSFYEETSEKERKFGGTRILSDKSLQTSSFAGPSRFVGSSSAGLACQHER